LAAVAGLLHDIGKFWQRTEKRGVDEVHRDFDQGKYGGNGAYATYSAAFVKQFVPKTFQHMSDAILSHQNPQDEHARRLALADRFAAAHEHQKSTHQHPEALISIFSTLGTKPIERFYVRPRPLELGSKALFPTNEVAVGQNAYQGLWQAFIQEVQQLSDETDAAIYLEALQGLMQRYCWGIPATDYGGEPDISLYDHSRVTAALAACLSHIDDLSLGRLLKGWDATPIATFIEGDISGIQRFIYTVPTNGAARQLRARSFYLQLLTDAVARFILKKFEMPPTNLIYSGGGRFYLLLPAHLHPDLQSVQEQLDAVLLKHHDGDLYLALGQTKLNAQDFKPEKFQQKWVEVGQSTAQNKRRRFGQMSPSNLFNQIFEPRGYYGDHEFSKRRDDRENPSNEDDWESTSAFGTSLDDFGRALSKANFIVLGEVKPQLQMQGSFEAVLNELGQAVALLDNSGKRIFPHDKPLLEKAIVLGIQHPPDKAMLEQIRAHFKCPLVGRVRYTVNVVAKNNEDMTADFSELQQSAQGLKRFGVLRMDVDNLGQLFASGFRGKDGQSRASLARVASLSFALSLYFEGYVGELCRKMNEACRSESKNENEKKIEAVYTVYSGGDDLFIAGRWDKLPELAEQIHDQFKEYACNNPEVHISAGITLHSGKYPLYRAAEEASEALEAAKNLPGKDGICFLGQPIKWQQWPDVLNLRDTLRRLINTGNVKRSLLQTLLQLHADYEATLGETRNTRTGEGQLPYGPWLWRSAYQFARLAERSGGSKEDINALYSKLKKDNFKGIALTGMTARWVDALTRKERS
jgi:CRISPR-associated protein Csm1